MILEEQFKQCPVCGKDPGNGTGLEDHIVETHRDYATPEMKESYDERHKRTAAADQDDQGV
jgi:hypothetical protein